MHRDASLLITGGSGFVGSHLLEYLLSQGYSNITSTDRSAPQSTMGITALSVDLSNKAETAACFEACKPDYIINLASIASVGDSFEQAEKMMSVNTSIMLSVLEAMRAITPHARLLQVSSAAVYGLVTGEKAASQDEHSPILPVNPYAVSKITQELLAGAYARSYKLDIVYARPFNHVGERQTTAFALPAFAEQIVAVERGVKDAVTVGNLSAVRDFTDVKDVVRAYEILLQKGVSGEVYNIGSGRGYTLEEVLQKLVALSTVFPRVIVDSNLVRPLDIPVSIADNGKISGLGWSPTIQLDDTVHRIIEWQRKQ